MTGYSSNAGLTPHADCIPIQPYRLTGDLSGVTNSTAVQTASTGGRYH